MHTPITVEKIATEKVVQGNLFPAGSTFTLTLDVFECSLSSELEMFWNIRFSMGDIEDRIGIITASIAEMKVFINSASTVNPAFTFGSVFVFNYLKIRITIGVATRTPKTVKPSA